MKFTILSTILMISSLAFGDEGIQSKDPYQSGVEIYNEYLKIPSIAKHIRGQFLTVPLNYKKPNQGTMQIYYRVSANFNPAQPTVFYFYGGPGGQSWASQFENSVPGVNFIYMDQRGTGFSRPASLIEMQTTDYFTSENIARDADRIRAAVGVQKLSVYGHSYGTVVAQIYASLFSAHTKTLILEGVVYDGTEQLWANPHRMKILNRFFARLPQETQKKIIDFTQRPDVKDEWLGELAQQVMYGQNFSELLLTAANAYMNYFNLLGDNRLGSPLNTDSPEFGAYMFNHIACKELSRSAPHANFLSTLTKEGKFIPYKENGGKICKTLRGFNDSKVKTYRATNYPVRVPTTYFQGTEDGATGVTNAIYHYKNAVKGKAQLILVTRHGHAPMSSCLTPYNEADLCPSQYTSLFLSAIHGEPITTEQLKDASTNISKWVRAARWKN